LILLNHSTLQTKSVFYFTKPHDHKSTTQMASAKTVVLISGANSGIGLAAATKLCRDYGYHVIIGSRSAAAGEKAAAPLRAEGHPAYSVQLDITSDESIAAAVRWVQHEFGVLDVLINNAGVMLDTHKEALSTRELFTQSLSANTIGAACLTDAFLPLLRKAETPRLLFVTSRMASVSGATDKTTHYYNIDYRAYDCSKAALNVLGLNYARDLEKDGVMVNLVCPGLVASKLTDNTPYGTTPEVGATRIVELATASKGGPTATFSDKDGPIAW
jgi:NAD(P)-dependent dehydrogenase (short-subunit alcohol dehydrogenase family)